ncbi:MAG: pseudouridine-5'-phosphate glycosidase, partial [Paracoccaceae bacterium]|nr:pseudouridine-5'-phosphate glycosidase [Paracoccaceae bacterium]
SLVKALPSLERIIAQATADAEALGITGKGVTPFLLQRIFDLTGGASLEANVALVLNNARLGAAIALALTDLNAAPATA